MQTSLLYITAVLVLCGVAQALSCIKIGRLRKSLGERDLEKHPGVLLWMRVCRIAWAVAFVVAIAAPIATGKEGFTHLLVGLFGPTLLLIVAASLGNLGAGTGDGDSGE